MELPTLHNVIDDIRGNLKAVHVPSADRNWWIELNTYFEGYPIIDYTDFNYDKSHLFIIIIAHRSPENFNCGSRQQGIALLRRLDGHVYHYLWLRLSVVAPYYLVGLSRRTLGDDDEIVDTDVLPQNNEQLNLLRNAHAFARNHSFLSVPREYLEQLVPGVELELAKPGKVTVYNCLFADG